MVIASPVQAQDAQAESVRGIGAFGREPIGIELDRLIEHPFDLTEDGGYDPDEERGILSTFILFPTFEVDFVHTDNIFRTSEGKSDLITIYRPRFEITSDWTKHSLSFSGSTAIGRHKNHPIENYEDYALSAALTLDVDEFTIASANLGHARSHGQRGDIDDPGETFRPEISFADSIGFGFNRTIPDGFLFDTQVSAVHSTVDDNGPLNNSDREVTDYNARVRVGWEIEEGTTLFVQPRAFFSRFRVEVDQFGTIRDHNIYELTGGIRLDPSPITFLEFLAGASWRENEDPIFDDTLDYLARGVFLWNPTSIHTINASLDQSFAGAAAQGISGTLTRTFTTSVDWTPRDPVVLTAETTFQFETFEGTDINTSRRSVVLSLIAEYVIDQNIYTLLSITRDIQTGDSAADEVRENRVLLRLGVAL